MAGSKKNKLKKMLSPPLKQPTPDPGPPADDGLLDDLLAQLEEKDASTTKKAEVAEVIQEVELNQQVNHPGKDSRSRFEARKARKAAELAAQYTGDDKEADARLEQEAREEELAINTACQKLGLVMHEINPDGHCLFAAIADQLHLLGVLPRHQANYMVTRAAAAQYMYSHPDDFIPFLPSATGEDGSGSTEPGIMTPEEFSQYCATVRNTGIWGGEPEIQALSKAYNIPIHVIQSGNPPIVVHDPTGGAGSDIASRNAARISFHRRMYGLGEHYNSLRPKPASILPQSLISPIFP